MSFTDTRMTPDPALPIKNAVVLLPGNGGDILSALAQRWRSHLPQVIFAAPQMRLSAADNQPNVAETSGSDGSTEQGISVAQASLRLGAYIDALKEEYGINNNDVILVGFGIGVNLAVHHGLTRAEKLGAMIGFSGGISDFDDLDSEIVSRPPVLLVHGETDPFVSPSEFLSNYVRLQNAKVPTYTCFRPKLGHAIDALGADAAMFFLQGVLAANAQGEIERQGPADECETPARIDARRIKLVIWDLDETLWDGTLDDVGEIRLNKFRVDAIRRLNQSGVVSAICSKNDFATAQQALEKLEIWDEFVFPRIAFVPKGDALKSLVSDMQLRPENCVFIDDNEINLAEARAMLPNLHVLDANAPACDLFLQALVDAHAIVQKSRVEEYRSLQARVTESREFDGDRENFLATCDIQVCVAWKADVADFAPRLEELINRTNQLNYLKTRIEPGKMIDFVSEPSMRQCLAVFAWDKFGYHGLVGFIGVDMKTHTLLHMAFSCRVMHMGIENWLLHRALAMFPNLKSPVDISVRPYQPSWLNEVAFGDHHVRKFIFGQEGKSQGETAAAKLRIMANCHSGVLAHFSGMRDKVEIDNFPRAFVLSQVLSKAYLEDEFPPALVYEFGTDFYDNKWPEYARPELDEGLYEACASEFCAFLQDRGHRMLVVGPARGVPDEVLVPRLGITRRRIEKFTAVWERMARKYPCVEVMDIERMVGVAGMLDYGHFTVEASQKIAKEIAIWFNDLPEALFDTRCSMSTAKVA
jgi:FkbH-like protein